MNPGDGLPHGEFYCGIDKFEADRFPNIGFFELRYEVFDHTFGDAIDCSVYAFSEEHRCVWRQGSRLGSVIEIELKRNSTGPAYCRQLARSDWKDMES